jgi:hypothetical protein
MEDATEKLKIMMKSRKNQKIIYKQSNIILKNSIVD